MKTLWSLLLVLSLMACSGGGGEEGDASSGPALRNPQVGATQVFTEPSFGAAIDRSKHVCTAEDGTPVEVLEEARGDGGSMWKKVRITEGPCGGREGWVPALNVGS